MAFKLHLCHQLPIPNLLYCQVKAFGKYIELFLLEHIAIAMSFLIFAFKVSERATNKLITSQHLD